MIKKIPNKIYNLYENPNTKERFYLRLRWRLCPFEKISEYIPKKGTILDVGCGYGMLSNLLAIDSKDRNVVGIDLSESRIKVAKSSVKDRKNVFFKVMDVKEFKLKECKGAVMSDFLHHIPYEIQENTIREIYQKLDKGGILIIQDVDKRPRLKFFFVYFLDHILNPGDKIYYRDRNNYKSLLENIGFNVEIINANKGLPLSDVIYVCKKLD